MYYLYLGGENKLSSSTLFSVSHKMEDAELKSSVPPSTPMEKETKPHSSPEDGILVIAINGERFEISDIDPSTTLLHFLRSTTRFKSAKHSCGEGGCGACVVLLSKYDPLSKQVEDFSISSCLTLLCSINGCSVTTSEGLGNSRDGFHPIHQRFSGFHASQCGFCSPGMCMSFFSALSNAEKTDRPEPPEGFSKLSVSEAERAIAGHLCRCTGYRPIADACKSFAADVDLEDLGLNSFWKKVEKKEISAKKLPVYDPNNKVCTYPEFLKEAKTVKALGSNSYTWHSPVTQEDLRSLLNSNMLKDGMHVKLVAGNTGVGYFKEVEPYDAYIYLRNIPVLSTIRMNHGQLEIGAAASISKVIANLKDDDFNLSSDGKLVFLKIADHLEKIASSYIRNSASIGGNIVMAQRSQFPSDIATVLLAVGSTVTIASVNKDETMDLEKFLAGPPLDSKSVLLSVHIPLLKPKSSGITASELLFESYRAAPRPLGNALPYLNAAFFADVSFCKTGVVVNSIQLSFGAYGTKHAVRARLVEDYLSGKVLSAAVLYEALKLVKAFIVPEESTPHSAYRTSLAVSFLFQFLFPFINVSSASDSLPRGLTYRLQEKIPKCSNDGYLDKLNRSQLLSSGKQVVESSSEYSPVGEPMAKSGSSIQASGEAVYVDDIPSPPSCLHGAFVYSTKPLARIKAIDLKPSTSLGGVTAVLSYKDISKGGENVGIKTMFGFEPLFADDITRCTGEAIAFVVAETQKCADVIANTAVVTYDVENMDPPILTVEEAVKRSSFFDVPPFLYPNQVGDFSKGMAEADHRILSEEIRLGSQYYFYMETQTALAIPDEDNCMVVYSSTQCPEAVHSVIAKCLGVPEHNIRVITRRVGGGFGGKAMKAIPVATACALAAHKLRRPVRIYLNRKTDMIMTGGRHPMKVTYSVGYKSNGRITALHLEILINAGITSDISPVLPSNMVGTLKKYNWGAFSFDIKVCKTNHSSKSAMRGPGEMQASFIAESIIERVADMLSLDVDSVRNINLHTYESLQVFYGDASGYAFEYTLQNIWDKLAKSANLAQRYNTIEQFNLSNTWRKRGISRVPVVNEVFVRPGPGKVSILTDGTIVVEVGGIELGQGLWTKVKQMAAYALGSIKCAGTENLTEKVRVIQSDTLSLVQGGFTAGSTTSESSCEAVRLCCNLLVERLIPVLEGLQKQTNPVNWDVLIQQAQLEAVNLAVNSYFAPDVNSMRYLNYGAAVSEVEVNLLTGDTTILQADIIYDCGQSMNPAVDLGQIEGAFVQGIGFFMLEEYLTNDEGLAIMDGTWTYKIPTIDTIPKQFNVEILNSGHHKRRVLSSKASGEPPLLLAASIHCAIKAAVKEAQKEVRKWRRVDEPKYSTVKLNVPAIMPVVKEACGLDIVERYLETFLDG